MADEKLSEIMARAAAASFQVLPPPKETRVAPDRALALARIPDEYREAEFGRPWCDPVAAQRAMIARPGIVFFYGEAGTGKTTLATALYLRELELGDWEGGAWIAANRMVIEATREVKLGAAAPLQARARRARILLLDDLGQDPHTEDGRALIEDVLAERHRRHRPTIVTSGLPGETLEKRYGAGVFRRLVRDARAIVIECREAPEGGWGPQP